MGHFKIEVCDALLSYFSWHSWWQDTPVDGEGTAAGRDSSSEGFTDVANKKGMVRF